MVELLKAMMTMTMTMMMMLQYKTMHINCCRHGSVPCLAFNNYNFQCRNVDDTRKPCFCRARRRRTFTAASTVVVVVVIINIH